MRKTGYIIIITYELSRESTVYRAKKHISSQEKNDLTCPLENWPESRVTNVSE